MAEISTGRELWVGPGEEFTTLHAAVAASQDGDTIFIRAGVYENDFSTITHAVSIIGVGGMAHLVATEQIGNGKAILVTDADTVIENVEFSGAVVADRNGAGIRQELGNLTVRNSYFHDNENGILSASNPTSQIVIDHSVFDSNGNGSNKTHHVYIGNVESLTVTDSTFTHVEDVTHIQSRAFNTTVTDSTFDDTGGTASYLINLINAGEGVITGNTLVYSQTAGNRIAISYGTDAIHHPGSLLVDDNIFINYFNPAKVLSGVRNATDHDATVTNNLLIRFDNAVIGTATESGNILHDANVSGGSGADILTGTAAADVIDGFDGNDVISAGNGDDIVIGGGGNDTLHGEGGNDLLIGGVGNDVYVVGADNEGNDVIVGFTPSGTTEDKIDLTAHTEIGNFSDLLAITADDGKDTTISFANGDSLTLTNVLKTELTAGNFLISDGGTPPTSLSPDQISGLNLWLDSTDGATLVDSDTDGKLNVWLDKSGAGHDAAAPAVVNQPALSGGVTFDGADDVLHIADASDLNLSASSGKTLTLAFTTGADVATRQVLFEEGGALRGLNMYIDQGELHLGGWNLAETSWGPSFVNATVAPNATYVTTLTFDANAGTLSGTLNGISIGSLDGVATLHAHSGDIGLGGMEGDTYFVDGAATGDGFSFAGTMHEAAFFDRALTGTEENALQSFLIDKWNADGQPVNQAPVALDDAASTAAGGAVVIDVLANDSDPDGDSLSILSVGAAGNGVAAENTDGTITYTPNAGFTGDDSFSYAVADGHGGEASATVTVTVQDAAHGVSPDQVSGLNLWLDGSDASTLVDSNSDGNLNTWLDKSGAGHDATAAAVSQEPGISGGVVFDGSNDGLGIADASDLNLSTSDGKTLMLSFTTGADVTARQVLYEEGGTIRGLNMYVEGGQVHLGGWNLAETSWGPSFVNGGVEANTTYVASLTFDANAGTLSGSLNGVSIGDLTGVAPLHAHSGDIGLGEMKGDALFVDGSVTGDGFSFGGTIHEAAFFDRALSGAEQSGLETSLMDKWGAGTPSTASMITGFSTTASSSTLLATASAALQADAGNASDSAAVPAPEADPAPGDAGSGYSIYETGTGGEHLVADAAAQANPV